MQIKPLENVEFRELLDVRNESESLRNALWRCKIPPHYYLTGEEMAGIKAEEANYFLLEEAISKELKRRVDSYFVEPEK